MSTPNTIDPAIAPQRPKVPHKAAAAVALALVVGFGAGVASNHTPASCLQAIDYADRGFTYAADGIDGASAVIEAVSRLDVAGVDAGSAQMGAAANNLARLSSNYKAAKAECRGSNS